MSFITSLFLTALVVTSGGEAPKKGITAIDAKTGDVARPILFPTDDEARTSESTDKSLCFAWDNGKLGWFNPCPSSSLLSATDIKRLNDPEYQAALFERVLCSTGHFNLYTQDPTESLLCEKATIARMSAHRNAAMKGDLKSRSFTQTPVFIAFEDGFVTCRKWGTLGGLNDAVRNGTGAAFRELKHIFGSFHTAICHGVTKLTGEKTFSTVFASIPREFPVNDTLTAACTMAVSAR